MKNILIFLLIIIINYPVYSQSNTELQILQAAIDAGCLTNGSLKRQKSTGKLYYKKESVKQAGKMVRFYPDMSFEFEDGSNRGKWKCPELNERLSKSSAQKLIDEFTKGFNRGLNDKSSKPSSSSNSTSIHKCAWCSRGFQGNGFSISGGEIRIGKYYDPLMAKMMGATDNDNVGDYCSRKCAFDSQ